jgi:hypothetical protein
MTTKAGRKRRAGKREPNGQLSRKAEHIQARRSIDEDSAMSVAKAARVRVHDVAEEHAGTDMAATVIGRLFLKGELEPEQVSAARLIAETYAAYQRAIDSPRPPKAVNIGGASGSTPPDVTPEQAMEARRRWGTVIGILQVANNAHRGSAIYAACDYVVLRDIELSHLFPDMRLGLNAIVRAYRLGERSAA